MRHIVLSYSTDPEDAAPQQKKFTNLWEATDRAFDLISDGFHVLIDEIDERGEITRSIAY